MVPGIGTMSSPCANTQASAIPDDGLRLEVTGAAVPPALASTDPCDRRDEELLAIVPRDRRQPYAITAAGRKHLAAQLEKLRQVVAAGMTRLNHA